MLNHVSKGDRWSTLISGFLRQGLEHVSWMMMIVHPFPFKALQLLVIWVHSSRFFTKPSWRHGVWLTSRCLSLCIQCPYWRAWRYATTVGSQMCPASTSWSTRQGSHCSSTCTPTSPFRLSASSTSRSHWRWPDWIAVWPLRHLRPWQSPRRTEWPLCPARSLRNNSNNGLTCGHSRTLVSSWVCMLLATCPTPCCAKSWSMIPSIICSNPQPCMRSTCLKGCL